MIRRDKNTIRHSRKPSSKINYWNSIKKISPPPWISNAVFSVFAMENGDPFLVQVAVSVWMALFAIYSLRFINYQFHMNLRMSDRGWLVPLQVILISLSLSPSGVFAQVAGGGTSCTTAGFLNKLATFADTVFTPATGAGVSGGAITSLQAFTCTIIGVLVLAFIVIVVGGIVYVGFQMIVNDQQFAQVGRPVAGIIFVILILVSFIYLATTAIP